MWQGELLFRMVYIISSLPTPKREGYVFNGWYRDNQKVTSIPAGTGDITLVAHWTEISYTLSFKTNNVL